MAGDLLTRGIPQTIIMFGINRLFTLLIRNRKPTARSGFKRLPFKDVMPIMQTQTADSPNKKYLVFFIITEFPVLS